MPIDPEVASWQADLVARADVARAYADRVSGIEATARTRDGVVEVTVGADGSPRGIRLRAEVTGWPPDRIAQEILTTMSKAQARLGADIVALTCDTFGAASETSFAIAEEIQRKYGIAEPDEEAR